MRDPRSTPDSWIPSVLRHYFPRAPNFSITFIRMQPRELTWLRMFLGIVYHATPYSTSRRSFNFRLGARLTDSPLIIQEISNWFKESPTSRFAKFQNYEYTFSPPPTSFYFTVFALFPGRLSQSYLRVNLPATYFLNSFVPPFSSLPPISPATSLFRPTTSFFSRVSSRLVLVRTRVSDSLAA